MPRPATCLALVALFLACTLRVSAQTCPSFNYDFLSQEQVDRFPQDCEVVQGFVRLRSNSDIDDLSPLSKITNVGAAVQMEYLPFLTTLSGLDSLQYIGGTLVINYNALLPSIDALSALTSVGGGVLINFNPVLTNVDGLSALTSIGGPLSIQRNPELVNVDGLSALTAVGDALHLNHNGSLEDVNGLSSLSFVGRDLSIIDNDALTDLDALVSLTHVGGSTLGGNLYVGSNANLGDCCGLYPLIGSGGVSNRIEMGYNHCPSTWECGADSGNCNSNGLDVLACRRFSRPVEGDLYLPGRRDSIVWHAKLAEGQARLEFSADLGAVYHFLDDVPADSGTYYWDVPDTLLTARAKVRLRESGTGDSVIVSDRFRVKPYVITRLDASEYYEVYDPGTDRWGFANVEAQVWPPAWWGQFDYQGGIDPITGLAYDQTAAGGVFANADSSDHPDWTSWVRAFGEGACYTDVGLYRPLALLRWEAVKQSWAGSCFGIAVSNALAFQRKADFLTRYPDYPDFAQAVSITADDTIVPRTINALQSKQYGDPFDSHWTSVGGARTPKETISDLRQMLSEDHTEIRTLTMFNNGTGGGGHGIVAHKLEQDPVDENLFNVWVYDNSYPGNTNAVITVDTSGAEGRGTWNPEYGWSGWGGDRWFALANPASDFFGDAEMLSKRYSSLSPFTTESDRLEVFHAGSKSISVTDLVSMQQSAFDGGGLKVEIPDAVPIFAINGSEGPPLGFSLPTGEYSLSLSDFSADISRAFFFTGNRTFKYQRSGATASQTDSLQFDGALKTLNFDSEPKTIWLLSLVTDPGEERLFLVRDLEVGTAEFVELENLTNGRLKLDSYGSARRYGVSVEYVSDTKRELFEHNGIDLVANTSHTFVPDWQDIGTGELVIYVDEGRDGSVEDTLTLENQSTTIDRQGSLDIPREYRLDQNYPNPFNGTTTFSYALPTAADMKLTVVDVLGRKVGDLVSGTRPAGTYKIVFDASGLPSGIYFYRLHAGDYVDTKRMVVVN